jgi:hypothetical protein
MTRIVNISLCLALTLAAADGIGRSALAADQAAPDVMRSLAVEPTQVKRSGIVAVVASVPVPPEMQQGPSTAQVGQLRDAALANAKESAIRQVRDDLAGTGSGAVPQNVSPDDVYVIQLTELPIENNQYKVLLKAEVRYALAAAPGQTPSAAVPRSVTGIEMSQRPSAPVPAGSSPAATAQAPVETTTGAPGQSPTESLPSVSALQPSADNAQPIPLGSATSGSDAGTAPTPGTASSTSDAANAERASPAPPAAASAPVPPETSSTAASPVASPEAGPLTVRVWTDQRSYQDGERLVVHLQANHDFYGRLVYEDVAGKLIQMLPNDFRSDSHFQAATGYAVPGEADKFQLVVKAPFGSERITLYASTAPLGDVPTAATGNGVATVEASRDETARLTRSLAVVPRDQSAAASGGSSTATAGGGPATAPGAGATAQSGNPVAGSAEFYEASWDITTLVR